MDLGQLIFKIGKEVLKLLDIDLGEYRLKCRMLYYKSVQQNNNDGSPYWCGSHRDHGLFTGLCPAVYIKNGMVVDKPSEVGLFIRGKEVKVPNDVLMFQVGEVAQLVSNGNIQATEHHVQKAFGYTRQTFAAFFMPSEDYLINSTDQSYSDRYVRPMTYKDWEVVTYKKYYKN
jgi:isopenicillin N synthase-like dioxygenase